MPELPEVETVRRTLEPALGATIAAVWTSQLKLRQKAIPRRALTGLVGGRISGLRRIGKYLLIDTAGEAADGSTLLVHLGMSGRFRLQLGASDRPAHTHVELTLDDGARVLRFSDPRRFGQIDVVTPGREREHPSLAKLGPDPLVDGVDPIALLARARGKAATLKAFLLDQTVLAGPGNIYVSEALWLARLRPTRRAATLTATTATTLAAAVREVLVSALANGGTSLRDFVDADGAEGENAEYLQVYGRDGEPCPRCAAKIRRTVLQGRATYHCPRCQP
jgi:formamidopyrimidine-DNA glycosylase